MLLFSFPLLGLYLKSLFVQPPFCQQNLARDKLKRKKLDILRCGGVSSSVRVRTSSIADSRI
jgi:hypothetical protein